MQKIIWAKHTLIVLTCVHCYLINLFLNILSHIPLLFFSFQVVMVLASKGDHALNGLYTRINTRHILETSKMVFNLNPFLYFIFSLFFTYLCSYQIFITSINRSKNTLVCIYNLTSLLLELMHLSMQVAFIRLVVSCTCYVLLYNSIKTLHSLYS